MFRWQIRTLQYVLTALLCFFASALARESEFTMEEGMKILAKHNELRAMVIPLAANMEKMKWDDRLARMAQDWADECVFEHGQAWPKSRQPYTYIGQNIWMGTRTQTRELTSLIVQDWWDEINYYTYENHTCLPGMICGHYTQVATAESVYVGCGKTDCTEKDIRSLIVVCNYQRPMANPLFPWPYKKGAYCSKCASQTAFCDNGLCAECKSQLHRQYWPENTELLTEADCSTSTSECYLDCYNCGVLNETLCHCDCAPGWDGLNCAELCYDVDPNCPKMLPPGARVARCNPLQYDQCKMTCGRCKGLYEDSEGLCCDGHLCENGGLLDVHLCTCICYDPFIGERCEDIHSGGLGAFVFSLNICFTLCMLSFVMTSFSVR